MESEIQEKVTEEAENQGLLPIRINVKGRKGWPDYGYGYKGRILFVEFKRKGEVPDPLQEEVHLRMRKAGFTVFVVDNFSDGKWSIASWRLQIDSEDRLVAEIRQGNH